MARKTGINGRPRGDLPFIERRDGGAARYRRRIPADLQPVLGEAFVHLFPAGISDATIREVSAALAQYHDGIIAERRERFSALYERARLGHTEQGE